MAETPTERSLRFAELSLRSWAATKDRTARTAKARAARNAKYFDRAREMHPELPESEIAIRAEQLRLADLLAMARKAAKARSLRKQAEALDAEVAEIEAEASEAA